MTLVFVPRYSPNPIQDYETKQLLAEYDPDRYAPIFPHKEPERFKSPSQFDGGTSRCKH